MNNKNQIKKIGNKVLNIKTQIPVKIATMLFILVTICITSCNQNKSKADLPETPNSEQIFNDLKNNNIENYDSYFDESERRTFKRDNETNTSNSISILDKTISNTNIGTYEVEYKVSTSHFHPDGGRVSEGTPHITVKYQLVDNNWNFISAIQTSYEPWRENFIPDESTDNNVPDNSNTSEPEKKEETKKLPICEWCGQEISGNVYHGGRNDNNSPCRAINGPYRLGPYIASYHQKCAIEKCEKDN
ncbi:MAG: hypothetical protein ACOYO1_08010 [Bacteroidales bacterium]